MRTRHSGGILKTSEGLRQRPEQLEQEEGELEQRSEADLRVVGDNGGPVGHREPWILST